MLLENFSKEGDLEMKILLVWLQPANPNIGIPRGT
jgi:hypothetical protein